MSPLNRFFIALGKHWTLGMALFALAIALLWGSKLAPLVEIELRLQAHHFYLADAPLELLIPADGLEPPDSFGVTRIRWGEGNLWVKTWSSIDVQTQLAKWILDEEPVGWQILRLSDGSAWLISAVPANEDAGVVDLSASSLAASRLWILGLGTAAELLFLATFWYCFTAWRRRD